jgi:hypothetical protein
MRDYVERLERVASGMPEGQEPTHEDVMETYFEDADNARDDDE